LSQTLPTPARAAPVHPESEQVLLSLVLALPPSDPEGAGLSPPSWEALDEQEGQRDLLAKLRGLGARADRLLGGALVVTVPQMASAQDGGAQGAHCAVLRKECWRGAQVAGVAGRGSRSQGGMSGEVVDRAWRLLDFRAPASPSRHSSAQIRIDHVSAGL